MRCLFKGGYYINLPVLERRLLFKGGIYSRGALIQGNTVYLIVFKCLLFGNCIYEANEICASSKINQ